MTFCAARRPSPTTCETMGAINWGDLLCTDIELRRSLIGKGETIVATIEEASPDAAGLRAYVQDKLGRDDVKIETE